jgi:predicted SAM-dependent methyltransferase
MPEPDHVSLTERLGAGEFEFNLSVAQSTFYRLERLVGDALFRRPPPVVGRPALLNLGCGPHIFEGWVNADDYAFKRALRETAFRPNWRLDITRPWKCAADHWDGVFTEHVLEHVSYSEAILVMRECLRTMKPGAWLRISVPDVRTYVELYEGRLSRPQFAPIPHPAVGISFLTQMHMHRSAWDADLMTQVLTEIGFADARAASFGQGADPRLLRDDPDKVHESLYVEARKA